MTDGKESVAAEMIRRFRQSRPTSRTEREISKKSAPRELWWIDEKVPKTSSLDRDQESLRSPSPEPMKHLPVRQTSKFELLDSWDNSNPRNFMSKSYDFDKQRSSVEVRRPAPSLNVDSWFEKEIAELEQEVNRRSTKSHPQFASKPFERSGNMNLSSSIDRAILGQSWLRGSNDTLGSLGLKALLDPGMYFFKNHRNFLLFNRIKARWTIPNKTRSGSEKGARSSSSSEFRRRTHSIRRTSEESQSKYGKSCSA